MYILRKRKRMPEKLDIIEKIICDIFQVDADILYSNSAHRCMEETDALHFLWYVLHYDANISSPKISKNYKKSLRHVKRCIAKIKYGISTQKFYKNTYERIKNEMRDSAI